MTDRSSHLKRITDRTLRERAEGQLRKHMSNLDQLSTAKREDLIQELQVHQIELELQNEELRDAQNRLESTHQKYMDLYNLAPVGYASLDDSGLIWRSNSTFSRLLGVHQDQLIGQALVDFMDEEDRVYFLGRFTAFSRKPESKHIDVRFRVKRADGQQHQFIGRIQGRRVAQDAPMYGLRRRQQETLLIVISDITELKKSEQKIEHQALHDALTGLPNRNNLHENLAMALAQAQRHSSYGTLIFMDLDRFKNVNDSLGHHIGDELLIQFANRLKTSLRHEDLLVRMGGDEFLILLSDQTPDRGSAALDAHRLANHLIELMEEPLLIADHQIQLTISIGIAVFPFSQGDSVNDVIREADTAMYQAKQLGRNQIAFFHNEMQQKANQRLTLESELRNALEQQQFELYYQPQVDINGNVRAIETLVRWNHPNKGIILPGHFISIMEDTGLIEPLGKWVLEGALETLAQWSKNGIVGDDVKISINTSPRQFQIGHMSTTVSNLLEQHGLQANRLTLEITESLLLPNDEFIRREMSRLSDIGVTLAVDDFGTGFSSLSVLQHAPINQLKIDRQFIYNLDDGIQGEALVQAILSMASALQVQVVAEGVETETQFALLKKLHCDLLQGYLIAKPMPTNLVEKYLLDLKNPETFK